MLYAVSTGSDTMPTSIRRMPPRIGPRPISRRRKVGPQAGVAIDKLAHAIEYLQDELLLEGLWLSESETDGRPEAIRILKVLNRQIYYECPIALTLSERLRNSLLRFAPGFQKNNVAEIVCRNKKSQNQKD